MIATCSFVHLFCILPTQTCGLVLCFLWILIKLLPFYLSKLMPSCVALALEPALRPSHKLPLCSLCSLVPTCQMAGLTPVSSPASMRYPVSENQMNHFHRTDALLTDRLSWPLSSARLALMLTARSGEPALWLSPGWWGLSRARSFRGAPDSPAGAVPGRNSLTWIYELRVEKCINASWHTQLKVAIQLRWPWNVKTCFIKRLASLLKSDWWVTLGTFFLR